MADVELTTVAQEAAIDPAADKFPYIDVSLTPDATRYATVDNMLAAVDASTTEVLTGTSAAKAVTPDALAALWEQGSDIASAGTISVGEGGYHHVTGTTTITDIDFATDKAGRKVWLEFDGILTLTHHATTLKLPTGANIVTAAGDVACFVSQGSDNVKCVSYNRASGAALAGSGGITNSAGNNVIPKSDGTNLVASLITDNATDITLSPPAAGSVIIQQAATPTDDILKMLTSGAANIFSIGSTGRLQITERILGSGAGNYIGWGDMLFGDVSGLATYANISYNSSYGLQLRDNGGNIDFIFDSARYVEMYETTAPSAGAANSVRLFIEDNGSGKTRLMALFSSGAAQQLAIQP